MTTPRMNETAPAADSTAYQKGVSLGVIEPMVNFPRPSGVDRFARFRQTIRANDEATSVRAHGHLFKSGAVELQEDADPVEVVLVEMDRHNIDMCLVGIDSPEAQRALEVHPERFRGIVDLIDPNDIGAAVRRIRMAHADFGVVAAAAVPALCQPQVSIDDRRFYPIYQTCVDLGLPMLVNAGVAGPRVPSACQEVIRLDRVCYEFPDLTIVIRHGAEPWEALAVKLMLQWPGLHYMTSAFAPKYYPQAIIDFANTRGSDKVMYAGYYPTISFDRIFQELPDVSFRDDVWPKFLHHNAARVFGLDDPTVERSA
jgi:predicted TIM-barrel fold metal-dependent hydrolase